MTAKVEDWDSAGLQYEVVDGVAWLRMNRPHKRNAMDHYPAGAGPNGMGLRDALLEAIHEVSEDNAVKVAVITGNGTVFSSGADITQQGGPFEIPPERRRGSPHTARDDGILYGWARLMDAIWRSETPFIAAVNGMAAGGGCQLALACDLTIAAEEASFWEIFVRRGLPLEGGGAWILPRLVGLARAKQIALFGDPLPAATAAEWGLINECVPGAELESTAREWANKLATLSAPAGGPRMGPDGPAPDLSIRIGHIKSQLNLSLESTMYQTFREEATLLSLGLGPGPE
ncbi:enoyl-CoA hydratase/isomerase family protein [Jatrophihabitans sp. DSM 45814]